MAASRQPIDPDLQARLREMAAELRQALYGEAGFPEWGTKFREIEKDGMSVGLELARLVMEQSVGEQARHMPPAAAQVAGDDARVVGTESTPLQTEAGPVVWNEPKAHLRKSRKAFFPPPASAGAEGR